MQQRTIAEKISCTGIGLHTGAPVRLTLLPARAATGIVFVRTDGAHPVEVAARPSAVSSTQFATTLGRGSARVGTVEHLLGALYALGIDNIRVEVDAEELPVMDGSAASFVYLIHSAGTFAQPAPRRVLRVRRPIEVCDGERRISVEPARGFRVSYAVEFEHPAIGRQELHVESLDPDRFEREISAARTFGFLNAVREMWSAGFGRGGSLDNTVMLDDERVLNPGGLRWPDEFVRHKVLDLYGDLALLGMPLQGHIRVERGGHSLHHKLISAIRDDPDAWRVCDPDPRRRVAFDLTPLAPPAPRRLRSPGLTPLT